MAFVYDHTNNIFTGDSWSSPTSGSSVLGIPATGPITITQDGVIKNDTGTDPGLSLLGGPYTITVNGLIERQNYSGSIALYLGAYTGAGTSKITVGDTGVLSSARFGIAAEQSVSITNAGLISGHVFGIMFLGPSAKTFTLVNSGTVQSDAWGVYATDGTSFTVTNSGDIMGSVISFTGTEKVTNSGWINAEVKLTGTVATVSNTGHIVGFVETTAGADSVTNSGVVDAYVELNAGDNKFTNSGKVNGNNSGNAVNFAGGNDTMVNSGTITSGSVQMGDGANKLTNSGTIDGGVILGTGNDSVKNTGHITAFVELGDGNDSYSGGNYSDYVFDGSGSDSYKLGGGEDSFKAWSPNLLPPVDGAGDKVDGGTNTAVKFTHDLFGDIYDASGSLDGVAINAHSVAHSNADDSAIFTLLAKGTASSSSVGADLISGFETFYATAFDDLVFGDAKGNGIFGYGEDDHLHGGAGNDWVDGGDNDDEISGDAGADWLIGSGGADKFIYHKLSDSTVGLSGRDVIMDFTEGDDRIDLHLVVPGGHINTPGATDTAFDGLAGAVRAIKTYHGWQVQVDSNGDHKVDMSIQVNDALHVISWDVNDFIF